MADSSPKHRSNLFISSFQIEAICEAIRTSVSLGASPGPETIKMLADMRDEFISVGSGLPIQRIPKVAENMNPQDLLAVALLLRTTILAYLTPEDLEEHTRIMGFRHSS